MVLGKDYADLEDLALGMGMIGPAQVVLGSAGLVLLDLEMKNPARVELNKGKTFYCFKHATKEHKDRTAQLLELRSEKKTCKRKGVSRTSRL